VRQTFIGNFGTAQGQLVEMGEPLKLFKPFVGNLGLEKDEIAKVRKWVQEFQSLIGKILSAQTYFNHRLMPLILINLNLATEAPNFSDCLLLFGFSLAAGRQKQAQGYEKRCSAHGLLLYPVSNPASPSKEVPTREKKTVAVRHPGG
jgi:hypothetical protein